MTGKTEAMRRDTGLESLRGFGPRQAERICPRWIWPGRYRLCWSDTTKLLDCHANPLDTTCLTAAEFTDENRTIPARFPQIHDRIETDTHLLWLSSCC